MLGELDGDLVGDDDGAVVFLEGLDLDDDAIAMSALKLGVEGAGAGVDAVSLVLEGALAWDGSGSLSDHLAACLRAGLWSRRIKNNTGTNVLLSLVGAAAIGVFTFVRMSAFDVPLAIHLACAAIAAGATFVLARVVLQLCSAVYKKRHEQLENEFDKEEKDD